MVKLYHHRDIEIASRPSAAPCRPPASGGHPHSLTAGGGCRAARRRRAAEESRIQPISDLASRRLRAKYIPLHFNSCKTNPIPGGAGWGRGLGDHGRTCEANPICAKRTQFGAAWLASRERIVQNKPNFPGGNGKGKYLAQKEL
jgi:hypothetical protein